MSNNYHKQECIQVGCVPSTAVAVCLRGVLPAGSAQGVSAWECVCPSACWDMFAKGVSAPVHAGICLPRGVCRPQCMLNDQPSVHGYLGELINLRSQITMHSDY